MRYLILILTLLVSSNTFAQVGKPRVHAEITDVGQVKRTLNNYFILYTLSYVEVEPGLKGYVLIFTNENTLYQSKETDLRSLKFTATRYEFDYLYNFLLQGFNESRMRSIEVGEDIVKTMPHTSKYLYIYVDFQDGTSASLKLKKRELAKLFGKANP